MSASATVSAWGPRAVGARFARRVPAVVDLYRVVRRPRWELAIARDVARTRTSCRFLRPSNDLPPDAPAALVALYRDDIFDAKVGLALASALRLRGLRPVVSVPTGRQRRALRYAKAFGVRDVIVQEEVELTGDERRRRDVAVELLLAGAVDHATVAAWRFDDQQIGTHVLSTVIRLTFDGSPDLAQPGHQALLRTVLCDVITSHLRAEHVMREVAPQVVLVEEANYSVNGPLVDVAVARGIDIIQTIPIWRDDALMSKRLTAANRRVDAKSVAPETFAALVAEPLTAAEDDELDADLERRYGRAWRLAWQFQPDTEAHTSDEIVADLGLDPTRPTAVIFAHVLWDATLFFGVDLFENYAEWLAATVGAAIGNPRVNWLVKAHPSNVFRTAHGDVHGEPSEIALIRERFGTLPDHVRIVAPDTRISAMSLYRAADAAVTVRGTPGLEMACFGKPAYTAGTGNYAGLGFTEDSDSVAQYLDRLGAIDTARPLTPDVTARARRYAHTLLVRRPWRTRSFSMHFDFPEQGWTPLDRNIKWTVDSVEGLHHARDLDDWSAWALGSRDTDFLPPSPGVTTVDAIDAVDQRATRAASTSCTIAAKERIERVARDLVRGTRAWRARRIAGTVEGILDDDGRDVLVEVGVAVPLRAGALVVGADPLDDRVTCLADLRTRGSLPARRFDLVALADARPTRDLATLDNAVQALRPGGVLVCGSTFPLPRWLRRSARVTGRGIGPWRVVEAHLGRASDG